MGTNRVGLNLVNISCCEKFTEFRQPPLPALRASSPYPGASEIRTKPGTSSKCLRLLDSSGMEYRMAVAAIHRSLSAMTRPEDRIATFTLAQVFADLGVERQDDNVAQRSPHVIWEIAFIRRATWLR